MNADFFNALDLLEKENGISKEYMISQMLAEKRLVPQRLSVSSLIPLRRI